MTESSECQRQFHKLKMRCTFRWFHSKGAVLVLVWVLLSVVANRILFFVFVDLVSDNSPIVTATIACALVAAPFFGWLADAKLGNYKVMKIGITVTLLVSVLVSLFSLLNYNILLNGNHNIVAMKTVLLVLMNLLCWIGVVISIVSSFQLSLEQIPDGSAENITSLISWFVLSIFTGYLVGKLIMDVVPTCIDYIHSDLYQALTLFPVMCASVNFILFHLISPKWLIIEPKSPQSLKNIYRVLKFAAKHKAPLNRSALTYWEEDIPSRLDLGKSRYGGPFTTEQVEDVKIFFRILAMSVGIFLTMFSVRAHKYDYVGSTTDYEVLNITSFSSCQTKILFLVTLHPVWCAIVAVLLYEFLIYPCFNYRLPSSMRRIGIVSFAVMVRNVIYLVVSIMIYFNILDRGTPWIMGINSVLYGVLLVAMFIPSLEFVCAQAPYNMRGLMTGYIQLIYLLALTLGHTFAFEFIQYCQTFSSCSLASVSVGAALSIFAFLLYLIIAHWYKRRVRDDIDTPHKWVEDVYDRYLSAVNY